MKKFIYITFITLIFFFSNLNHTYAANWIRIIDNNNYIVNIDTDSFIYDSDRNIVKCWINKKSLKDNTVFLSYEYFKLNDNTSATRNIIVYESDGSRNSVEAPYMDYEPIIPGTVTERVYYVIKFIGSMYKTNLDWEFNREYIGAYSSLDSPNWVEDSKELVWIDAGTIRKFNGYRYMWVKSGEKLPFLKLYKENLSNNKRVCLSMVFINNGKESCNFIFPVLIWPKNENLSIEEKEAFMKQADVIIRM